jgi:hypothetical protein
LPLIFDISSEGICNNAAFKKKKEIFVMKKLTAFALMVIATFGSARLASAQTPHVRAQIPFDFTAGSAQLPAGEYSLVYERTGLLTLLNIDNRNSATILAQAEPGGRDGNCKLIFARYGDQYFLKQSKCSAGNANYSLRRSSREERAIERASADDFGQRTVIASR